MVFLYEIFLKEKNFFIKKIKIKLVKVESYRGDIIHSFELTDRLPNPNRLTEAYYKSSSTL